MQTLKTLLQTYWNNNSLRRLTISTGVFALILLILPVVIQYSIIHLLKKQGASQASIDDINLNLFAGSFELRQLSFTSGNTQPLQLGHLALDLQMQQLFSKKLVVDSLRLDGLNAVVQRNKNGDLIINGLKLALADSTEGQQTKPESPSENPFGYGLKQLSINHIQIDYQESDFLQRLSVNQLSVTGLESWTPSSITQLDADFKIDDAATQLSAELQVFATNPRLKGHVVLADLSFTPYAKFYQQYVTIRQGSLSLKADFDVTLGSSIIASSNYQIQLDAIDADYQQIRQTVDRLVWTGKTDLDASKELTVSGELRINDSKTIDTRNNYLIAGFDFLNIEALEKSTRAVSFDGLSIQNLSLINSTDTDHFITLDSVNISRLNLDSNLEKLSIQQIMIARPVLQLKITEQKQVAQILPLQNTLAELIPAQPEEQPVTTDIPNKPIEISIDRITLTEPGSVDFTDHSVAPNYRTVIFLNQLDIEKLASNNIAHFVIALKQGDYTSIDVSGDGQLFDPTAELKLKAQIKQLDLPPVTPYTSQAMGYGVKSGSVDTDIDLSLLKREIDAFIKLKVDSIEVVETNQQTAEQVSSASGMSIDLAISTLKDSENIIQLELPVKGNIDQPDFDLSLIVNQAMGKAMQSASLSYLKHTLQPLGSLITLYSLAKTAASHIALPPVLFATNSLEFRDDQQPLLDKVVKVLKERPGLKIKACGVSSLEDQNAIRDELLAVELERLKKLSKKDEQIDPETIQIDTLLVQQRMRDLADQRSAKVKATFLQQGEIESRRILNCLSASKTEEKSQASVELTL